MTVLFFEIVVLVLFILTSCVVEEQESADDHHHADQIGQQGQRQRGHDKTSDQHADGTGDDL